MIVEVLAVISAPAAALQEPPTYSLPLSEARDATGEGIAFVEVAVDRPETFAGAPVRVVVRFGLGEDFLDHRVVQPFGRPLDVPVQLAAPWIGAPADGDGPTFALNDGLAHARRAADREVGGSRFRVWEVAATLLQESAGELALAGPTLAFAYATRFEDDFVRGRAPLDRVDAFVRAAPVTIAVRPLPAEGRPPEFTGAVGDLSARASVDRTELAMGESLRLALTIEGEGNLAGFGTPALDRIGAFRVLGTTDDRGADRRTIVYDLAPQSEKAWQVPAIPFAYFDPVPPAGYRIARTDPIDVRVRPAAGGSAPTERGIPVEEPAPRGTGRPSWVPWVLGLLAVAILAAIALRPRPRKKEIG